MISIDEIMRKILCIVSAILCILLASCGNNDTKVADGQVEMKATEKGENKMYKQITAEEAKKIMDSGEEYILIDVREQDEFETGHIPGAVLIPYTEINKKAEEVLPDKDKQILVYCRSGRRSKIAAESLATLGYSDVKEFGGIIDWHYEVEK